MLQQDMPELHMGHAIARLSFAQPCPKLRHLLRTHRLSSATILDRYQRPDCKHPRRTNLWRHKAFRLHTHQPESGTKITGHISSYTPYCSKRLSWKSCRHIPKIVILSSERRIDLDLAVRDTHFSLINFCLYIII